MKNRVQDIAGIPFWTRLCVIGLLSIFIHFKVVLPVSAIQQTDLAETESIGEKESELETEELDEVVESAINNLFPPMAVQLSAWSELASNALNNFPYNLFDPPPECI
jgi:hypothetical protein